MAPLLRVFTSKGVYIVIFTSQSSGICRRAGLWQNIGNSFEVTATMSLLCISSHIEDGCSSRSRAHTEESNQTPCFLKPGIVSVLIFNTFLMRAVHGLFVLHSSVSEHLLWRSGKSLLPYLLLLETVRLLHPLFRIMVILIIAENRRSGGLSL